jgi:hypothetical protein
MRRFLHLAVLSAVICAPAAARAEDGSSQKPYAPKKTIGVHVFAIADSNAMAASQTFKAVLGSSQLTALGGGVDVTHLWKGLFVRVAGTHVTKDGTRVFADNGQAFPLNIRDTVSYTPFEAGVGWRFAVKSKRLSPYLGGTAVIARFKETSDFADPGENVSQSSTGGEAFGGVDFTVYKCIVVGGEAQYRSLPNALGKGGASKAFDDTDLGGFTARVTIGVSFGK